MAKSPEDKVELLQKEVNQLHETLQGMGKNSTLEKDFFGRRFVVPVDDEHKATQDPLGVTLCVCANPHMRAFHTSWFGFFASFYSTFAAASLNPYIIPDLKLAPSEWALSNTMAVMGTIFFRLAMGWICDKFGARRGLGFLLLGTTPAIVLIMFAQNAWQFILLRCVIGFSLATFVACQTWCSQMFAKKVVGIANATAAGWGNLGGGVTNLTMPYVFLIFMDFTTQNESLSWRLSYIVPLALHIIGGMMVLTARDLPDGNYGELEKAKAKVKSDSSIVLKVGFSNINAWLLTLTYGFCFGVELTMNSQAARYFYTYHGLNPQIAGICGSCWGLMNLFARSLGGYLSDWSYGKAGMRGRLWSAWIVQTIEGVFCIILGYITLGFDAPHKDSVGGQTIEAWINLGDDPVREHLGLPNGWTNLNATCFGKTNVPLTIKACATLNTQFDDGLRECLYVAEGGNNAFLRQTAPTVEAFNCVSNSNTIAPVMVIIILFSLCVQAAEGLHYGIVPSVSRPALGVVSGMVGAGGNAGAVITGTIFFRGVYRTDLGFIYLGAMIIAVTALLFFVHLEGDDKNITDANGNPDEAAMKAYKKWTGGSMCVAQDKCGNYDPQIIHAPEGYGGADKIDYSAAADGKVEANGSSTTANGGGEI